MSSTNRSKSAAESRAINKDYYVTPVDEIKKFADSFFKLEPLAALGYILDPCAGGDANHPMSYPAALSPLKVTSLDIRADSLSDIKADYLSAPVTGFSLIITNPPFNLAQQIIEKAYSDVDEGGFVIMLLRLNFLGSKGRMPFWKKYKPKYIFIHPIRMSFLDSGQTDSIEYAHFVWQKAAVDKTELIMLL